MLSENLPRYYVFEGVQKRLRHLVSRRLSLMHALLRNDSDEWSISHKLAEYLQTQFSDWHVDVEYNRDKNQVKELNNENVHPDIIVHIRDTDNNLLVIEVKKSNNLKLIDDDRKRLIKFTSQEGKYKYLFGFLVIFYVAEEYRKPPLIELFQDSAQLK